MSRRKDRERFSQLKQRNPGYVGFRGTAAPGRAAEETVSVVCSVCRRKRNVSAGPDGSGPADRDAYVCLQCQQQGAAATEHRRS